MLVAYDGIRAAILDGRYPQGTHLKEELLAASLGVSRTPVREALRRLAADGMIRYGDGQGAQVARWSDVELEEIIGLRAHLESYGARLAARRITAGQLAELQRLDGEMMRAAADKPPDFLARIALANDRFHKLIMEAAQCDRLAAMINGLIEVPLVLRTFRNYSDAELHRSLHHHGDVVAALGDRDAERAEAVMRAHLLSARRLYGRDRDPYDPDRGERGE